MRFDNYRDLERAFTAGKLGSLPEKFTVGDITYVFMSDRTGDARSIFNKGHKPVVIYRPSDRTPHDNCVVFAWTLNDHSHIVPGAVITIPQSLSLTKDMFNVAASHPPINGGGNVNPPMRPSGSMPTTSHPEHEEEPTGEEDAEEDLNMIGHLSTHPLQNQVFDKSPDKGEKLKQDYEGRTIGKSMDIILIGFNRDQPIKGKIDTGAVYCSLHAENINIKRNPLSTDTEEQVISFVFNEVRYTMNLEQYQAISSADGGVEQRPVVRFDVRIKDAIYHNILFNLNDRGHMQDSLLIGSNLLEKGKFLIDPTKESVDWKFIAAKLNTLLS